MASKNTIIGIAVISAACIIALSVALILALVVFVDNPTEVTTNTAGIITGNLATLANGDPMYEFYNIPYAVAPVGELRFQPPQTRSTDPSDRFDGTNSELEVKCIQGDSGEGSEDCLVLTIRSGDLTASKPVIVWIHGGGLYQGHGSTAGYSFDSELTATLDSVTVNINYRLGFLGFSSVEELWNTTTGVYANNGIRDQVAALEWLQENVAAFGGDPDSVTIIGESGGGTAVLALVSSPLANNKFHRAISLSPAPEMRFNYSEGNDFQRYYVTQAGCTQDTLAERRECLMGLDASSFSAPQISSTAGNAYFDFPMRYTTNEEYMGLIMTDPTVVPTEPSKLKDAQFTPDSPVTLIISSLAQENAYVSYFLYVNIFEDQATLNETLTELYSKVTNATDMLERTYALYPDMSAQMIWDTLTTDMRGTCPINDVAQEMADSSHHNIYRLYITNSMGSLPYYSAFHVWDTYALFGFTSETMYTPSTRDMTFQAKLVEMVKSLAEDGSVEDGWETFPQNTLVYGNTDNVASISTDKPQKNVCTELESLDLVKYGWQNK